MPNLQYIGLGDIQVLGNSPASLVTNAAGEIVYIRGVTMHNTDTSQRTVLLYVVPDSTGSPGTAGTANQCFEFPIAAKDTFTFEFPGLGIVLRDEGDSLQAEADVASKVNILMHGDVAA